MVSNSKVSVRTAVTEDIPSIVRLEKEAFGTHAYDAYFLRQAHDVFGDLFCVAVDQDDAVVGHCITAFEQGSHDGWVLSIIVSAGHRNNGIGAELLNEISKRLTARGAEGVLLTVHPDNMQACAAYRKINFQEVEAVHDYFFDGEARIIMRRSLQ